MKKIPQQLLDAAAKYAVNTDDNHRMFAIRLLQKLQADPEVTAEQVLALSDFAKGTDWVDAIHLEMVSYVKKLDNDIASYPYSQLFTDFEFRSKIMLASESAALALLKDDAYHAMSIEYGDRAFADLCAELCYRYLEVANFIFVERNVSQSIMITRILIIECDGAPMRLAKVLSRAMSEENSDNNYQVWYLTYWHTWCSTILNKGNTSEQFLVMGESERAAELVLRDVLSNYYNPNKVRRVQRPHEIDAKTLVELAQRWPRLACSVVDGLPKDDKHMQYIADLIPSVIQMAAEGHIPSLVSQLHLVTTGVCEDIPQDLEKALSLCRELLDKDHINGVVKAAELLTSGKPWHDSTHSYPVTDKNIWIANCIYQMILEHDTIRDKAKALASMAVEAPEFSYQLAECYQLRFQYDKAIEYYENVYEESNKKIAQNILNLSRVSTSFSTYESKSKIAEHYQEGRQFLAEIGPESKLRIAMCWSERLARLNEDPSIEPELCLRLAQHYFKKEKLEVTLRLYMSAVTCDQRFWDNKLCLNVASALVFQGDFKRAAALLRSIPEESIHFQSAQNMLQFGAGMELELVPLVSDEQPLLEKEDITDYVLPFYEAAAKTGHKGAQYSLEMMQEGLARYEGSDPIPFKY